MTSRFGGAIFTAHTVEEIPGVTPENLIRRPVLENTLNQKPWVGRTIVINGPAGTGKTTFALQWAAAGGQQVQYVSARGIPRDLLLQATPPWRGGEVVAGFINAIAASYNLEHARKHSGLLNELLDLIIDTDTLLVVDDLDLLPSTSFIHLVSAAVGVISQIRNATIVLISRRFPDAIYELFGARGPVQVVAPQQLQINPHELEQIIAKNIFAPNTEARIREAHKLSGGWFRGMQQGLVHGDIYNPEFDDFVLNEIVMSFPAGMHNVIFALATFSEITEPTIEAIFQHAGLDTADVMMLTGSFPFAYSSQSINSLSYRVPPCLARSLHRISSLMGNRAQIRSFQKIGVETQVESRHYESARLLAQHAEMNRYYLQALQPVCQQFALREEWNVVADLVDGIAPHDLLDFPQILFWAMMADSRSGRWNKLQAKSKVALPNWLQAEEPYRRSMGLLLQAWESWVRGDADHTLSFAAESYRLMEPERNQDRVMASATAEYAARCIGDSAAIEYWTIAGETEQLYIGGNSSWWHENTGAYRISHLATSGELRGARHMASYSMQSYTDILPRSAFYYATTLVRIEIERNDIEAAHQTINGLEALSPTSVTEESLEILRCELLIASGEYDRAKAMLQLDKKPISSLVDNQFQRMLLQAEIEILVGNLSMAEEILTNWSTRKYRWPRFFGDHHHGLLMARLLVKMKSFVAAIDEASKIVREAEERGHFSLALAGYAILVEAMYQRGDIAGAKTALARALEIDTDHQFHRSYFPLGRDVRTIVEAEPLHEGSLPVDALISNIQLTSRERELLIKVNEGLSNPEISIQMYISQSTVKNHLSSAFRKLGVRTREDAVTVAVSRGLIPKIQRSSTISV